MFYIITKNNCGTCKKALDYFNTKNIAVQEINVNRMSIPSKILALMENIQTDSEKNYINLKSFIRYNAPYFKRNKVEAIMMSERETRTRILASADETLSFPIILSIDNYGIRNFIVGFSNAVLDRWINNPETKGDFFNLNRAYGDMYCCHECVAKEKEFEEKEKSFSSNLSFMNKNKEALNFLNNSSNYNQKSILSKNYNKQNSNLKFNNNNITSSPNRIGKYNEERERIFQTQNYSNNYQRPMNNQNPLPQQQNLNHQRVQEQRMPEQRIDHLRDLQQNLQPIYVDPNMIYQRQINNTPIRNQDKANNLPRLYNSKPQIDVQNIIKQMQQSQIEEQNAQMQEAIFNQPEPSVESIDSKLKSENSIQQAILRRIGMGEEIGQPEFSSKHSYVTVKHSQVKNKVKGKSSNVSDFLEEINEILHKDNVAPKTLNEKYQDYGFLKKFDDSILYVDSFSDEKLKNQKLPKQKKVRVEHEVAPDLFDEINREEITQTIEKINQKIEKNFPNAAAKLNKNQKHVTAINNLEENKHLKYFDDIENLDRNILKNKQEQAMQNKLEILREDILFSNEKLLEATKDDYKIFEDIAMLENYSFDDDNEMND